MDKAKKKRIKKVITWLAIAAVVALLTAMPLLARQEAEADGPVASILSAEVKKGTITTALHGGGTVSPETVEEVKLPSGVKIEGFLVKNGQFVKEGTPVASVDKVSVMTAINEVQKTMDFLREELENARDEKVSSTVKATAGGRVKKIFAEKGESVQEVMLRDGALAILSLDGLMAVKLEENLPLTTGESVTAAIGEKEVTGRVESNLDGVVIITVEDEGYEIGEKVTLSKDGAHLGESTLYIHNAWKATAYTGTIEAVNAKEEKTLHSGATLFTLTDRDYEGELRRRASQHREYEQLLQDLFQMYETGCLTAPCDGEVEGVDEDSAYLLSAVPEGWVVAPLNSVTSTEEKPYKVLLLGNTEDNTVCDGTENCKLTKEQHPDEAECLSLCIYCKHKAHDVNCLSQCNGLPNCPNANNAQFHKSGCQSLCTGKSGCLAPKERHSSGCPEKCTNNALCRSSRPKAEHEEKCIIHCVKDVDAKDLSVQCDAKTHYNECIGRCTGDKECEAINHKTDCYYYGVTYTAIVGVVVRTSGNTIEYKYYAGASEVTAYRDATGRFTISGKPDMKLMNTTGFVSSDVKCNPGDIILIITGRNPSGQAVIENQVHIYQTGSLDMGMIDGLSGMMGGLGGMNISGMIGGFSGFGNYAAAAPEEEALFDLEGDTLLTVTAHHNARLRISIDEHDIAKVATGMKATVKVEALKGASFDAEVTNIALSGTNNGGSSKFTVELTLPMSEQMLPGMSASAVIPLEEKTDILTIPAAALHQQGAKTMVFTALDEKTGQPSSPVEVKTGISDGETVEILSGLAEGQRVYYSYYDTVELDTSAQADKYTLR